MNTSTKATRVYAFGSNGSGQLGIGNTNDVSSPEPVLFDDDLSTDTVSNIVCGGNHSLVLFKSQALAAAGDNSDGRSLSRGETETGSNRFVHRSLLSDLDGDELVVKHIAATWSASVVSYNVGSIHACGSGNTGELGSPDLVTTRAPSSIHLPKDSSTTIAKLASCMGHVVAVLTNGEVWGWGKGRKGQLGQPLENAWSPRKIQGIPFFVVDAVCGKDFTCVFGYPGTGEFIVFLAGNDRFGVKANAPTSVPDWKQVSASWGSIYVLLRSGELLAWGRNDHGQLPPLTIPPLEAIAAGSEHCLGLSRTGQVLAWGWSEHGNCGVPIDADGDVKGRWNELKLRHPATAIFAGCATSFIVAQEVLGED